MTAQGLSEMAGVQVSISNVFGFVDLRTPLANSAPLPPHHSRVSLLPLLTPACLLLSSSSLSFLPYP